VYGFAALGTVPRASTNAREYRPPMARPQPRGSRGRGAENWAIPLDVVQEGENIIVKASMPGVKPEDIDVSIEIDTLTIKGQTKEEREHQEGNYVMRERRSGSF
jgi:HSP20 family molecular chaperone IbpA